MEEVPMAAAPDRILTTHVGSLVRPPELVEFLKAIEAGQPYDKAAYEACLKASIERAGRMCQRRHAPLPFRPTAKCASPLRPTRCKIIFDIWKITLYIDKDDPRP
jgi:hypothetical protein